MHLALLNSLSSQPDEIVLIEPLIKRDQVHPVGWVKPFKISNRINDATDSRVERCSAPHLITDVITVMIVIYEDAQSEKYKDGDADHRLPIFSRRNGEGGEDDNNRRGSIAQEASEQKHQNRIDHERAEPNRYTFAIATLESRSQAEHHTQHPNPSPLVNCSTDTGDFVEGTEAVDARPPAEHAKPPKVMAIRLPTDWHSRGR